MMPSQAKPNVNIVWASGGLATPVDPAKQALGFVAEIPDYDTFNGMIKQISAYQKHNNQEGISLWDTTTIYPVNGLVKSPIDGNVYQAVNEHSGAAPVAVIGGAVNANWKIFVYPLAQIPGRLLNVQAFTASGTYTPTPGMNSCIVKLGGAGGAGGGAPITIAGNVGLGAGGHAGAYGEGRFTAAQIGASQVVTIGAGGVPTTNAGGNGGNTSLGVLIVAPGGAGGPSAGNSAPPLSAGNGNLPAVASSGANLLRGSGPVSPIGLAISIAVGFSGAGANSAFGSGGGSINNTAAGQQATGLCAGGSGGMALSANATARLGGAGAPGFMYIEEYT